MPMVHYFLESEKKERIGGGLPSETTQELINNDTNEIDKNFKISIKIIFNKYKSKYKKIESYEIKESIQTKFGDNFKNILQLYHV